MAEQHLAAPTTQGPADRAGQGGGPGSGPLFADDTMLAVKGKSNGVSSCGIYFCRVGL